MALKTNENSTVLSNLILLGRVIEKVRKDELKTSQEIHDWLWANGFKDTEEFRIEMLHKAEQLDAEESNKEFTGQ